MPSDSEAEEDEETRQRDSDEDVRGGGLGDDDAGEDEDVVGDEDEDELEEEDDDSISKQPPSDGDDEVDHGEDESREDDDDDTHYDENYEDEYPSEYSTKFNQSNHQKYLEKYHPEEIHLPFEQIHVLAAVERNPHTGKVEPDDNHRTYPILSKYEKTKIIGLRVSQLNQGAPPYIQVNHVVFDKTLIAEKELRDKKLDAWVIRRPLPNGKSEYWRVNDLEYIH